MARHFLSFLVFASFLSSVLTSPACSRMYKNQADCYQKCRQRWGYPGSMMGTDPWGSVMHSADESALESVVSAACGTATATASTSALTVSASVSGIRGGIADSTSLSTSILPSATSSSSVSVSSSAAFNSSSSSVSKTLFTSSSAPLPSATSFSTSVKSSSTIKSVTSTSAFVEPTSTSISISTSTSISTTKKITSTTSSTSAAAAVQTSSSLSSTASSSSGSTSQSDIDSYLADHNNVRSQHGAVALTWSDDLASKAQEWSDNCVFQHSGGSLGPFGENLAAGTGSSYDIAAAIESWTDEVSQYDPNNPVASHFTQVVWKASTEVGCAVSSCSGIFDPSFGLAQFYVCEYSPQGNVIGAFAQNVQV